MSSHILLSLYRCTFTPDTLTRRRQHLWIAFKALSYIVQPQEVGHEVRDWNLFLRNLFLRKLCRLNQPADQEKYIVLCAFAWRGLKFRLKFSSAFWGLPPPLFSVSESEKENSPAACGSKWFLARLHTMSASTFLSIRGNNIPNENAHNIQGPGLRLVETQSES